jgi:hypothetical protein
MRRMHARKNMGKIILLPDCEMMTSEVAANKVNTLIPVKEPKKKLGSVSSPSTDEPATTTTTKEPKTPEGECDDKDKDTNTSTKKKNKKNKNTDTTPVTPVAVPPKTEDTPKGEEAQKPTETTTESK